MSTINTNVPAVTAQRHLAMSQRKLAVSLERLSSGLKINRGADDPAGLIVSERLRAEIEAVKQSIDNTSRAINVIATTEGALDEVAALLIDIRALVVEAANSGAFSDEEVDANQLQLDSAIESITRIANTSTFAGRKLLNGQLDYVTSGINTAELASVDILSAKFGSASYVPVDINVSTSALTGQLAYGTQPGEIPLSATKTVDLSGPTGIVTLTFPANATAPDLVTAINTRTSDTGVSAVTSGGAVVFNTQDYGSRAFVSVEPVPGSPDFDVVDRNSAIVTRTVGRDAVGTINGVASVGDGLELSVSTVSLKMNVILDPTFGAGTTTFAITGGGALFQLGPQVTTNQQENIGVKAMQANKLGNRIVGFLEQLKSGQAYSLKSGNFTEASRILDEVQTQVSVLRGRLGAFERNTLQPNISQLQITTENLTSSESVIRDTDFAVETSELTRAQILVQAGNSILAVANAQSQNVLTLLGG